MKGSISCEDHKNRSNFNECVEMIPASFVGLGISQIIRVQCSIVNLGILL